MSTTDTTYAREISYDRSSRDYAMYLDGELVGYARTYHEAEITLDELVYELLSSGATATATQLDGDSDVAEPRAPICETCNGEHRIPAGGWGDQAGGWAETCPDCDGHPERLVCATCGNEGDCPDCGTFDAALAVFGPAIDATALLEEADAVIGRLYCGPNCYCPACMRAAERLIVDAYITRLQVDAGLICQFCGETHCLRRAGSTGLFC